MTEAFSFDDIYELLRSEKYSTDLQPLKAEDLKKIADYFKAKKELLFKQKKGSTFFDKSKKDKLKSEIENARRALKELYERREKKIINRALFTCRSDFKLKDSTNMLASEEKLYAVLVELLKTSFDEFVNNFKVGKENSEEQADIKLEPKELKESIQTSKLESGKKLIKFVEAVPEIIGTDLCKYGPFEKEATTSLPDDLADALIAQKKAEEVKNEIS